MGSWHERRLRVSRRALGATGAALALSACAMAGSGSLPVDAAENAATPDRTGVVPAAAGGRISAADLEAAVRADAARLWGHADPATLQVTVEAVTWSDGALGCPRPGVMYTQALVPGFRVVVRDGAREAVYHASARGAWVLCPRGRAGAPLPGGASR